MRVRPIDLADVLAYLVVLGLYIQFFPKVISESFLVALITAILLKVILEVVLWVKKSTLKRIRTAKHYWVSAVNVIVLILVLPGSKFLVLEAVAFVLGGAVYLGGFFQVTLLIISLMLARAGLRRMFPEPVTSKPATGNYKE